LPITLNNSRLPIRYSSIVHVDIPFCSHISLGTSGFARIAQPAGLGSSNIRTLSELPLLGVPVRQTNVRQRLLVGTHELGHAHENPFSKEEKEIKPREQVKKEEAKDIILQVAY
jgi:hypothetical protein